MNLSQLLTHEFDINRRPALHEHPGDGYIRATTKSCTRAIMVTGAELLERMARAQRTVAALTKGIEDTQAILDEALSGRTQDEALRASGWLAPVGWARAAEVLVSTTPEEQP